MPQPFEPITTTRLRLIPFADDTARAVVAGDLSGLNAADGWPQEGTANGLSMAIEHGNPPGWMVTLGGQVIGDCGTRGPADANGTIEIGYGLAADYRGRGYGTELVGAVTPWLLGRPEVRAVTANTHPDNTASRRVLEKNGFHLTGYDESGQAAYLPHRVLWWVQGDEYLGRVRMNLALNASLREFGGHIGYDIRPSARGRGHATAMSGTSLRHADALGIDPALLTCAPGNIASRRVIEHNGGALWDMSAAGRLQYWCPTA